MSLFHLYTHNNIVYIQGQGKVCSRALSQKCWLTHFFEGH